MLAAGPTASAYYGRAMTYVLSGDKAAGLKDLDQAIALEPANGVYKNLRAQIAAQK
jgi:predicted Zn-dependent protease